MFLQKYEFTDRSPGPYQLQKHALVYLQFFFLKTSHKLPISSIFGITVW